MPTANVKEVQGYHSTNKKCTKFKYLKDHTGYQSYQLLFESLYYSSYHHILNNEFYDLIKYGIHVDQYKCNTNNWP